LYGRVAKAYSRESAAKYGVTDLGAFLTYATLTHLTPIPTDPGAATVQVPQVDGSLLEKKFADCTRAELSAAIRHLKKPDASLPANEVEMAKHLLAIVDHVFGAHSPALARVQKGAEEPIVIFHVPFSQLPTLQQALGEFIGSPSPAGVLAAMAGTLAGASTSGPTLGPVAGDDAAIALGRMAGQQWKNFKRLFKQ
jgi:hypothetical protein